MISWQPSAQGPSQPAAVVCRSYGDQLITSLVRIAIVPSASRSEPNPRGRHRTLQPRACAVGLPLVLASAATLLRAEGDTHYRHSAAISPPAATQRAHNTQQGTRAPTHNMDEHDRCTCCARRLRRTMTTPATTASANTPLTMPPMSAPLTPAPPEVGSPLPTFLHMCNS